jgi:hypothetical protein
MADFFKMLDSDPIGSRIIARYIQKDVRDEVTGEWRETEATSVEEWEVVKGKALRDERLRALIWFEESHFIAAYGFSLYGEIYETRKKQVKKPMKKWLMYWVSLAS